MFVVGRKSPLLKYKWEGRPNRPDPPAVDQDPKGLRVQRAVVTEDFLFCVVFDGFFCATTAHHLQHITEECRGNRGSLRVLNHSSPSPTVKYQKSATSLSSPAQEAARVSRH